MKFLLALLFAAPAFASIPESQTFSGWLRSDRIASFCHIYSAEIRFDPNPKETDGYEVTWIEKGRYVQPRQGDCEMDYTAYLSPFQRNQAGEVIEWKLRFKFAPTHDLASVTKTGDVYRFRAETENWEEGLRYKVALDLFYNAEQGTLSYSRQQRYESGFQYNVSGPLFPKSN